MERKNPTYYIVPSAISIIPNANNSANDLAVYIQSAARISVYCPKIPELDYDDTSYQEWTLSGRNRRLMQGDGPYTIYARLEKENKKNGYLVFAAQQQVQQGGLLVWKDKYPYITPAGLSDDATEPASDKYWYIKIGTVSELNDGRRLLDIDTGILGTTLYNNEWQQEENNLPLRVIITNDLYSSAQKETGTPYIGWGGLVTLKASLIRGWNADASELIDHWVIKRNTGNATSDEAWNNAHRTSVSAEGEITLKHQKNGSGMVDDFSAAVSAAFTLEAWGYKTATQDSSDDSDSSSEPVPELLADGTITILAETKETFGLWLSEYTAHYNPANKEYTPKEGISIRVKGTAQDGAISYLTQAEINAAMLTLYYDNIIDDSSDSSSSDSGSSDSSDGSDSSSGADDSSDGQGTELYFNSEGVAVLPISAFGGNKSINLYLVNSDGREVANETVSLVRDGESAVSYRCRWQLGNTDVSTLSCTSSGTLKNVEPYPNDYIRVSLLKRDGKGAEKVVTGFGSVRIIAGGYTYSKVIANTAMTMLLHIDGQFASEINSASCKKVTVVFNLNNGDSFTYVIDKVFDGSNADVWTIDTDGYWCKNGARYINPSTGQPVQAEGKDGTGIMLTGTVNVLYTSQAQSGQTSLEGLTGVEVGQCYVVDATRHIYFYDSTSQETGVPAGWHDMGVFRGADGQNSYMHMAWADDIIFDDSSDSSDSDSSDEEEPIPVSSTGFITVYDGKPHPWLGLCTNNNPVDPADFRAYKWNYIKGNDGEGSWAADIDNEMDVVLTDSAGYVHTNQNVVSELSMYCGNTPKTFVIDKVYRNGILIAEHSGEMEASVRVTWNTNPLRNTSQILTIEYLTSASFGTPAREKDVFTISVYSVEDPSVMRDLNIVVSWKEGISYQLNPSVSQISVGRNDDGSYSPATYNLTCGYKCKKENGTVETTTDYPDLISIRWAIYFRRRHRPDSQHRSSYWETTYYAYGSQNFAPYVKSLDVSTYDAVEFIICDWYSMIIDITQTQPTGIQDREIVPVVSDGEKGDSPYVASLSTDMLMVHTTGNGKPTKNQTMSVVAAIRHGEEDVSVYILGVKRNGTVMTYTQNAWRALGVVITYNAASKTISITYNTSAQILNNDIFSFSLVNTVDGDIAFQEEKLLTVHTFSRDEYALIPSQTQIVVDRTGSTYQPDTFSLTCGYRKIDVDGQVTNVDEVTGMIDGLYNLYFRRHLRQSNVWESVYYLYSFYAAGQDDSSDSDSSEEEGYMLTDIDVATYDDIEFILSKNSERLLTPALVTGLMYTLEVPVLTNGSTGATGPGTFYLGEWRDKENAEYIAPGTLIETTQYERPYVSYSEDGAETLYFLFISPSPVVATDPGEGNYRTRPDNDPSKWEATQSKNKLIIADAIFTEFAKFGSAVINKDWKISGNGRIDGVEFTVDQQVTGKNVDATSSLWSTRAYMLFDPKNAKATSESVLYRKDLHLTEYVHSKEIGYADLQAGVTYSVRVWGAAKVLGNPRVFVKATRSGVGTTDILSVSGGVLPFNQVAFFRVAEDGAYVFDIYETAPDSGPYAGADIDYIQISKVSFAPVCAEDMFTGSTIQRDLVTSGFIRKDKTVISQLNVTDYCKSIANNTLNLDKCGSFIEVIDNLSLQLWLPMLCREYKDENLFPITSQEKDAARSLVGTKMLIYLTEGKLNMNCEISRGLIKRDTQENYMVFRHIFIDGEKVTEPSSGSELTDMSNTILLRVDYSETFISGQGWYYEYSWYFVTITSGQFVELECVSDTDEDGYELVYWKKNALGYIS